MNKKVKVAAADVTLLSNTSILILSFTMELNPFVFVFAAIMD
jgi:hypothetical protein